MSHIDNLIAEGSSLAHLTKKEYKMLLVITEVYRQQRWMYDNRSRRVEDRIVNLTQPHIRPIVRGKDAQAKRRFSLDRIMAKLEGTSQTSIAITFLGMNLLAGLRQIFCVFFWEDCEKIMFSGSSIKGDYRQSVEILENLLKGKE